MWRKLIPRPKNDFGERSTLFSTQFYQKSIWAILIRGKCKFLFESHQIKFADSPPCLRKVYCEMFSKYYKIRNHKMISLVYFRHTP